MQDNPIFADQIRYAMENMRENRAKPSDPYHEPMLRTWAAQVAWERICREAVVRAVWSWIIDANNGAGCDVGDLMTAMVRVLAPCPADLVGEDES